ncbi:hypothetical protein QTN47_03025 [Danxiaibacter flavus]|uniref:Peptidase M4 n=1 Tax=Danxiaibacter flavus TaxID=3049108 RepID=A0ABV3Z9A7_9BACT|nr:hypothetical protein QNM32_03020 [Chitinophagaceae bacterium DXS]
MATSKKLSRLLRGYSLDPGFSTRLDTMSINEMVYEIRWEDVSKGPIGEYFEVIDYDPASNCFYDPVELNSVEVLAQNGLPPSEGNPAFHQQFVYTIAMQTLEHFEKSLGRRVIWSPRIVVTGKNEGQRERLAVKQEYVPKLRLYPHAFREANAYYDPEKKAVLFGYFEAAATARGSNLPGGVIFSCLSPDIISHELTHALLDSIHPRFIENTNVDAPAFHEAFADIVALLQRFSVPSLLEYSIASTKGNLGEYSFLGELATQFGTALENGRGALRGAIGKVDEKTGKWQKYKPDPSLYHTVFEPHERGSVLVAVIFDAFIRLYNVKTADLLRIATNGSGILQPGAIHPDLVKRLAREAAEIAAHLLHVCIRALDYCPPVDITYGDYLRALITADVDTAPKDESGYRIALIEAFRSWGIFPDRVNTLSVESLCWSKQDNLTQAEKKAVAYIARQLKEWVAPIVELSYTDGVDRKEIYMASQKVQKDLHDLLVQKKVNIINSGDWSSLMKKFGLADGRVAFRYDDETITSDAMPPIEVHKVRPVYRVGREGVVVDQVIVTLSQTVRINKGNLKGSKFRGGCTFILNISKGYDLEYVIYKNVASQQRFKRQMDYQMGKTEEFVALSESMYEEESGFKNISFAKLHLH